MKERNDKSYDDGSTAAKTLALSEYQKYVESGLLSFDFVRYRDSISYYCMDHGRENDEEYSCVPFELSDRFKERIRKILTMPPPNPAACIEYPELYEVASRGFDLIQSIKFGCEYWQKNSADEEIADKAKYVCDIFEACGYEMGVAGRWPSVADDVIAVLEYASRQTKGIPFATRDMCATGMGENAIAFVSYSTGDSNRNVPVALVNYLESRGVRCWYAPRNIDSGKAYPDEIANAIVNALCFVLVLSKAYNDSKSCQKELRFAVDHNKPVLPFQIDDFSPTKGMDFLLGDLQRIKAFSDPEKHFDSLLDRITKIKR